jgi:hypothetical protein
VLATWSLRVCLVQKRGEEVRDFNEWEGREREGRIIF